MHQKCLKGQYSGIGIEDNVLRLREIWYFSPHSFWHPILRKDPALTLSRPTIYAAPFSILLSTNISSYKERLGLPSAIPNDFYATIMFTNGHGWCSILPICARRKKQGGDRDWRDAKMLKCMDSCDDGWGANKPITNIEWVVKDLLSSLKRQ